MSTSKIFITFLIFAIFNFAICVESVAPEQCGMDSGECINKSKAFPLKIIAIACILATSMVGVCLPLITSSVVAFKPDHDLFVIVKSFSAGIILGTGFMHVLPDSFDMLGSPCLPDHPWHKFPFTGLVAMFSAILTLMVDSLGSSLYSQRNNSAVINKSTDGADQEALTSTGGHNHNGLHNVANEGSEESQLLRYRIVAMVLEFGIIVHSVVIGLSLGASNNTCTIKSLLAALCFHQMFEGMGLGGCILQAEYNFVKKAAMAFFFAVTTPFGIALGMALSTSYMEENSPIALVVIGLLNGSSAGLLIYMALVDLLATDFMGPKLQSNIKLQIKSFIAVMLGAGGMSVMAIWA